jgi:hypothetical protein
MSKPLHLLSIAFAMILLISAGCEREAGPLPPLAAEQVPGEMQRVFGSAKPEIKNLVTALLTAIESKDYASAYQAVQLLGNPQDLTKEQRTLVARASLTVHGLLQTAQAQGDPNAAAAIKQHLISK